MASSNGGGCLIVARPLLCVTMTTAMMMMSTWSSQVRVCNIEKSENVGRARALAGATFGYLATHAAAAAAVNRSEKITSHFDSSAFNLDFLWQNKCAFFGWLFSVVTDQNKTNSCVLPVNQGFQCLLRGLMECRRESEREGELLNQRVRTKIEQKGALSRTFDENILSVLLLEKGKNLRKFWRIILFFLGIGGVVEAFLELDLCVLFKNR